MKQSMSISSGKVAGRRHNVRSEYREGLANVDPERMKYNVVLVDENLEQIYEELFGNALDEYNAKQVEKGHPERVVESYLDKIRASKQEHPSYEMVVQIGNKDSFSAKRAECRVVAEAIYKEFLERWRKRFPHLRIVLAAIHMDEATPHLHVEYVPFSEGNKRGLSTKNSLTGALKQDGCPTLTDSAKESFAILEVVSAQYGIERVDMAMTRGRYSVKDFKRIMDEQQQGIYAYKNDPRILELLADEQKHQIVQSDFTEHAVKTAYEMAEKVRDMKPWQQKRTAEELYDMAVGLDRRANRVRGFAARFKAAMEAIKSLWSDYVIQPLTDALRRDRNHPKVATADLALDESGTVDTPLDLRNKAVKAVRTPSTNDELGVLRQVTDWEQRQISGGSQDLGGRGI